jgi:cell wall-associated NlpC family hydrolase
VAIRFAHRVRPLLVLAALGVAVTVAPTLASAAPAAPRAEPSVTSVQKQLGALALKNTQLVEKYNQAQVAVQQREKAAKSAQATAAKATASYSQAHALFAQIVQAQYETDSLGATGALLSSSSDSNYLDRLEALGMMSTHTAQVVSQVTDARDTAAKAASKSHQLLESAKSERDALGKHRKAVTAQISKYQQLLSTLTSAQQATYQRATNPSVSATSVAKLKLTPAGSAAAQRAVQFALAQVGKPYVFGAAGPGSYDCSGLTMQAWHAGGISLPHSAADQYNYGHHVSRDQLAPGDLVFFYQPIGHVTIYIGDGLMVSAPTEGENVSVVPLTAFNGDYTGATRLT